MINKSNIRLQFQRLIMQPVDIAPLVTFRIAFAVMMCFSLLRFWFKGWIYDLYIAPKVHFTYYGFEWVKTWGDPGMYILFAIVLLATVAMAIGLFYRWASIVFFLGFTYIELIDKTTYLNHYYFISIVGFLMIFLPANRYFSVDAKRNPAIRQNKVSAWQVNLIRFQLGIVYFFAGIAKLNYDWLVRAMPLKLWLPAHAGKPIVGFLFQYKITAYLFSWFGAVYDLSIPFLLTLKRFRGLAYFMVVVFHVVTGWLFQIGMFPYIMIMSTLIFFSDTFHHKLLNGIARIFHIVIPPVTSVVRPTRPGRVLVSVLGLYIAFQLIFPFRHLMYKGDLFWHEQGFRFGWRVMLIEKAGSSFFYAKTADMDHEVEIRNCDYLTANQEKMMATQPDMILQFADIIKKDLEQKGMKAPEIRVESYVTLNGSGSRPFINPEVNLAAEKDSWKDKTWILPFEE